MSVDVGSLRSRFAQGKGDILPSVVIRLFRQSVEDLRQTVTDPLDFFQGEALGGDPCSEGAFLCHRGRRVGTRQQCQTA